MRGLTFFMIVLSISFSSFAQQIAQSKCETSFGRAASLSTAMSQYPEEFVTLVKEAWKNCGLYFAKNADAIKIMSGSSNYCKNKEIQNSELSLQSCRFKFLRVLVNEENLDY